MTVPLDSTALIDDFVKVAALSGIDISPSDVGYETLPAPHKRPTKLPKGKRAIYVFATDDLCLKVGKVGPKSAARFTNHHYLHGSSISNLAKSILAAAHAERAGSSSAPNAIFAAITESTVAEWIEQNTTRYHFYLEHDGPEPLLNLLEVFLQCRLKPFFEKGY